VGTEWQRQGDKGFESTSFPNRFFASREAGKANAPYFTVELGVADSSPPEAVTFLDPAPASLPPGEAVVSWSTPADDGPAGTLGFLVRYAPGETIEWDRGREAPRYLVPMAGKPGEPVVMRVRDLGLAPGAA